MIKVLEQAIEKIKALPPERQEYAAEVLESIVAGEVDVYELSEDEERLVREGLDDLDNGRVATEDQVHKAFSRFRT